MLSPPPPKETQPVENIITFTKKVFPSVTAIETPILSPIISPIISLTNPSLRQKGPAVMEDIMTQAKPFLLSNLRGDIFGGVTAAIIALPLALAFGVASGAGPIAGLYGAIAVGFFAALFGGTPAQVSGPTGPMTVVMGAIVAMHTNSMADAFTIVFLGGLIQIGFGALKLGRFINYTPYSVVSGFMSGIGIIIILIEVLPFFGLPIAKGGAMGAVGHFADVFSQINMQATALAALTLAMIVFWPKRLQSLFPAPLAALIAGTVLATYVLKAAPVIGDVPTGLPHLHLPTFHLAHIKDMIQPALILALLGSIDSLLTSLVADSITHTRHKSDRELIGQGIGNMVAGLVGGIPGAGATMRTVVNVRAGGRTPISGMLHALILLALVLGLGPLAARIPHAVLAGILMKVGWDIIDWGHLKHLHHAPREKVFVMLITLFLTVFVDLITAVAVGLIVASFVTARWMGEDELRGIEPVDTTNRNTLSDEEAKILENSDNQIGLVRLKGRFSYASARDFANRAGAHFAGYKVMIYDFSDVTHMDTSAALAVQELLQTAMEETSCILSGVTGDVRKTLHDLGVLTILPKGHVRRRRHKAIQMAQKMIGKTS